MNRMSKVIAICALFLFMEVGALAQQDPQTPQDQIMWQQGPCNGSLGEIATVKVPSGYIFADAKDTQRLMEMMHNPVSGTELGFLAKADSKWFVVFEFDEVGYIKDDEKNSLDSDGMLESIKKGTEAANQERAKRGWAQLTILGWQQPPRYNPNTHNLEWAIKGESEGASVVNWNTRLLGRKGVMRVTLVADPKELDHSLPYFRTLIDGFSYNPGNRYAEYRQGDKLAKYGLSALVVGGAAAVAAKTGLLKYLWKGLIVVGIAALGLLKKLFGKSTA